METQKIKFESLSPNVIVDDVNKAVDYYTTLLGFSLIVSKPESGVFDWAMVQKENVVFMFQSLPSIQEDMPSLKINSKGSLGTFYINVKGIDELYHSIKGKVEIVVDMRVTFYNAKEFVVKDLNGYFLAFAQDM